MTDDEPRGRRWPYAVVVVALLAAMGVAMVTAAVQQSPTVDEPVYVTAAVVYTQQHDLSYNPEHPPLGKLLMAAGLAFTSVHYDRGFTGSEADVGQHLLYASGNDPGRLLLAARLPIILLTLLFGLVVWAFARDVTGELGGPRERRSRELGGLVALALYAFTPDLIANGSLSTLDVPGAGFGLTSVWLTWRARQRPGRYLPLAGLALGAALATKMSLLPAVPVLLLLVVLSVRRSGRRLRWALLSAAGVALTAVAVVWLSYLAVDPRLRWSPPAGLPPLHGLRALVDWLPFPRPYRDGMRIQFAFEDTTWAGFLFGRQYQGPLWYYLPAALLVKTPLGLLGLGLAGAVTLLARPASRAAAGYVLVLPAVLLLAALDEARNLGDRYAIAVPLFLTVAAGSLVTLRWRWTRAVTGALVLFVAVSSVCTYPYYLPYSNEAFGGPAQTYRRLHDSNVDWGQDLGRLADRLRQKYHNQKIWLVYKGSGVPSYYGINAADPRAVPPEAVHGLLVISDDAIDKADARLAGLIRGSRPVDEVGHSITIFDRP